MSELTWVLFGAVVGYGGLAAYAATLLVRARRTGRTLLKLQEERQ